MLRRVLIYAAAFFLSASYAASLYVNSSFLSSFLSDTWVSIVFFLSALLSIITFIKAPAILARFGTKTLFLATVGVAILSSLGMAGADTAREATGYFLIYSAVLAIAYLALDIFLEYATEAHDTGGTRGTYLTVINTAIALGPLMVALFAHEGDLSLVYLSSALLAIPVLVLTMWLTEPLLKSHHLNTSLELGMWRRSPNLVRVTVSRFLLEFFFVIMVIYAPLYLHGNLGFSWQEIGVMFTLMLLPFILFEWPVGELTDKRTGEKEFMITGFLVTLIALSAMPFLKPIFSVWAAILFISRIGASFIEITTESYFFKLVSSKDRGLISIFRLTRPLATVLGTLVGYLSLVLLPFPYIFLVLGAFLVVGLYTSARLKDTA